jgi:hypothetical protein
MTKVDIAYGAALTDGTALGAALGTALGDGAAGGAPHGKYG